MTTLQENVRMSFRAAQAIAPFWRGTLAAHEGMINYMAHLESLVARGQGSPEAKKVIRLFNERTEKQLAGVSDYEGQQYFGNLRWLGMWGAVGCPVVRLDAAWAAAQCMTRIPKEFYEYVIPPWSAFMLEIPEDLGIAKSWGKGNERSSPEAVRIVHVARMTSVQNSAYKSGELRQMMLDYPDGPPEDARTWEMWWIDLLNADGSKHQSLSLRIDDLCGNHDPEYNAEKSEVRGLRMLYPLIGAVCMAAKSVGCFRKSSPKALRARKEQWPTVNQYVAGAPVKIDLRMKVKAFIEGGRKAVSGPMTIQSMVRGHWKNQPFGVKGTERKFIHVEPYWRGPEDAPIAIRPHVIFGDPA